MRKNKGSVSALTVLTFAGSLVLSACDDVQGQHPQMPTQTVDVVTLHNTAMPVTSELPGRTSAYRAAEVRPQVSGIILKRHFTEGSNVQAGESLYQIDPATYKAAYDSAQGELAKAEAAANIARLTLARYKKLSGTQYISQQDYDKAKAEAQQANAAVVAARAAVENAKINLAYTEVKAPIGGHIGKSNVTEGALVQSGQPNPLAMITQLDPIYVDISQSSNDYLRLQQEISNGTLTQENGKIKVMLTTANNRPYPQTGMLEFSDVTVDPTTGSITLRALFANPDHTLLPGMFVRARLDQGINPKAILVPQQAVSRNARGEASVMLVDKDNKVQLQVIDTVQAIGDKWLVSSGLQEGDRVVVSGLQKIQPGALVKPEEWRITEQKDPPSEASPATEQLPNS